MKLPVYLDYAATTPVDPRVADSMLRYLTRDGHYGNPASAHAYGQAAREAVETARAQVADLIHAMPAEVIWTSGATEANNLAIKGVAALYQRRGKHIVTLKTEHPSVLDSCHYLERQGFIVTYLTPSAGGRLDVAQFSSALRDDTILVSVMHVNNETGVIQDIKALADITAKRGILFHMDAAQSVGKISFDVREIRVDLVSMCAHKMYGPKGIGALYVRRKPRVRVAPLIHGGGQEQGMRSGTLPVHQIVGMGAACAMAQEEMAADFEKIVRLRDLFWHGIQSGHPDVTLNSDLCYTFPGILNVRFAGIPARTLMERLPELAFSTGSACHAKDIGTSPVLRASGLTEEQAQSSVRFSFGRFTMEEEIDFCVRLTNSHIFK